MTGSRGQKPGGEICEIHPARLRGLFKTSMLGRVVFLLDSTRSTNDVATAAAGAGAPEGTLVLADVQTAGRGRKGRRWFSKGGRSLVFSLILRPLEKGGGLTILIALSAARVLERYHEGMRIKWPNDIYCGGFKLGGILAEAKGGAVVMGVGLNVNEEPGDLAGEIRSEAVSLKCLTGEHVDRGELLAAVIEEFENDYFQWKKGGLARFRGEVEDRLLYIDEAVRLEIGETIVRGKCVGITEEGALRMQTDDGERIVTSGDLRVEGR